LLLGDCKQDKKGSSPVRISNANVHPGHRGLLALWRNIAGQPLSGFIKSQG
jgi:hypothetical protein